MINQHDLSCIQAINLRVSDGAALVQGVDCRKKLEIGFFFDGIEGGLKFQAQHY
ncbi:hypothetical protein HNO52_11835 [Billgrantia diversa]|uniref:hypothetical protein n=1 Tax=Halomonas sp. MCCC 1A13316 TaxID=2733487 RepID=UPI0018A5F3AF|nr:hypothetical protein [Halomonas sp. MCCC 1A13316]QOR39128.1 hypothetical protein HNO52_11835 [Halomonas sp. MCCC 1A13316]